jgi:putative ABC transport system substrate-binding protein
MKGFASWATSKAATSFERRSAGGRPDKLPELAAELVRLRVDAIVAAINPQLAAAKRATTTIPIVMVHADDPVEAGYVASLARPGGNITGSRSKRATRATASDSTS